MVGAADLSRSKCGGAAIFIGVFPAVRSEIHFCESVRRGDALSSGSLHLATPPSPPAPHRELFLGNQKQAFEA
jgi:hypothetical protein